MPVPHLHVSCPSSAALSTPPAHETGTQSLPAHSASWLQTRHLRCRLLHLLLHLLLLLVPPPPPPPHLCPVRLLEPPAAAAPAAAASGGGSSSSSGSSSNAVNAAVSVAVMWRTVVPTQVTTTLVLMHLHLPVFRPHPLPAVHCLSCPTPPASLVVSHLSKPCPEGPHARRHLLHQVLHT